MQATALRLLPWAVAVLAGCGTGQGGDGQTPETPDASCSDGCQSTPIEADAAVDECAEGTDDCDLHAACTDTEDSYECTCEGGFTGDGKECTDVDECVNASADCDPHATCTNTEGSFECACSAGFSGDGRDCEAIDECAEGIDDCDDRATCTNSDGSFECQCPDGLTGDGTLCEDVDECMNDLDDCDPNAGCTNTEGSFECACLGGHAGDGHTCEDVDECADDLDDCDADAGCTNTTGSFECECLHGFPGDGSVCAAVVQVVAGPNKTCAVLADRRAKCWGITHTSGTLGDEPGEMGDALTPLNFGAGRSAASIALGAATPPGLVHRHSCAVLDDGSVRCWGSNEGGTLGLGDTMPRPGGPDANPSTEIGVNRTAKRRRSRLGPHLCAARRW